MARLKIGTWNIKTFGALLAKAEAGTLSSAQSRRLDAIVAEIQSVDPDILCITEGPDPAQLEAFCNTWLGGQWRAVVRQAGDPYDMRGLFGKAQNILFIAKAAIAPMCALDPTARWRSLTQDASRRAFEQRRGAFTNVAVMHHGRAWNISHPFLSGGAAAGTVSLALEEHQHWRHPQVLSFGLRNIADGTITRIELIGLHMKSKINHKTWTGTIDNSPDHVREAVEARIKLTTEAINVRYYLGARFDQDPRAAIMLMGDLNDGPGRDLWEEIFLFHDLVSNLQGDIFQADQFLNHALFDAPEEQRWSAEFEDSYNPGSTIRPLLDHIMFSQRLVRKDWRQGLFVEPGAGRVEHEIHGLLNADLPRAHPTSDHLPVTCLFELEDGYELAPSPV